MMTMADSRIYSNPAGYYPLFFPAVNRVPFESSINILQGAIQPALTPGKLFLEWK
jgi:hypothetical protein